MYRYCFLFTLIFLGFAVNSFSQSEYLMRIANGHLVDEFTFQFDIDISASKNLEITSYQCVFAFFCDNMTTDDYTFSYVDGSTGISNKPTLGLSAKYTNSKIELTFASIAGSDTIKSDIVKVGTFKVTRKNKFNSNNIFINWNFTGDNLTILTGNLFSDITNPDYFVSEMQLTGIDEEKALPDDYLLEQNYPNPFNPSTKIKFYLKDQGKVTLQVFNILGEKVADLFNQELSTGFHEINFQADNLASGIYIYRLNVANKFTAVKKMILQR